MPLAQVSKTGCKHDKDINMSNLARFDISFFESLTLYVACQRF